MLRCSLRPLFFLIIAGYVCMLAFFGQPSAHSWHDPLVFRDAGTVWASLSWNVKEHGAYSIPMALMCHHQGPLQVLFVNAYYLAIGDLLPLNPITTQLPHVLIIWLCLVLFYIIARRLFSERVGYVCMLMFVLSPWLAMAIRRPWVFELFSCLFGLALFALYISYLRQPAPTRRFYVIVPPMVIALYLTVGLDWPAFFFALGVFLWLNKLWRHVLKNPYYLAPGLVVAAYGVVILLKHTTPEWAACERSLLTFPFQKIFTESLIQATTPLSNLGAFLGQTVGLIFPLALLSTLFLLASVWSKGATYFQATKFSALQRNFLYTMGGWFLLASVPYLKYSASVSFQEQYMGDFLPYGYVLGISGTFLAALLASTWRKSILFCCVLILAGWQWWVIISDGETFAYPHDDRRSVAGAAFLNEYRADLLEQGQIAFLPGNVARPMGQYARGVNWTIFADPNIPQIVMERHMIDPVEGFLGDFFTTYFTKGTLLVNWLVLTPELLQPAEENPSAQFYWRVATDPQINWIACLQDTFGRKAWIGEVKPGGGTPLHAAKVYDVAPLADLYQQKYNRIRFLKRNVKYILHY